MKLLKRITAVLGLVAFAALSQSAVAATSVSWLSPADGSSFPVGTMVMPNGNASAIGTSGNGLDLALVLDSSGSMSSFRTVNGVSKRLQQWQKDAAIALVNNLPTTNVSVTVIEFDSSANTVRVLTPLSTNIASVIAGINSVNASGGTNIGTGIDRARIELTGVRHTAGWSQQMVVFSDGFSSGNPPQRASVARTAGITVHSVALPGASIGTMSGIASAGGGTFINASTPTGIADLIALFSGAGGSLVGIDHVDISMPDGTLLGSVAVDAFGNFKTPAWLMELGANTFTATAFGTDGTQASATLTLNGTGGGNVPEPGIIGLFGLGLLSLVGIRRRKA